MVQAEGTWHTEICSFSFKRIWGLCTEGWGNVLGWCTLNLNLILLNQPVNKVKTCPGSAPLQALLRGPVMRGVELCDHPCRTPALCRVKRAVNGCELRGPHRRPHVQTACRPRRPLPRPAAPLQAAADWSAAACWCFAAGPGKGERPE